jgi:hypothetical protein
LNHIDFKEIKENLEWRAFEQVSKLFKIEHPRFPLGVFFYEW